MAFSSSPGNGNDLPTREIKAKGGWYNGFWYTNQNEKKFACYVHRRQIEYLPHPPHWADYEPDFGLPQFHLTIEVKPWKGFDWEYEHHREVIENSGQPWICVAPLTRQPHGWHITDCNDHFILNVAFVSPEEAPRIEFGYDLQITPYLKIYGSSGTIIVEGDLFG
jgi:hypothetical protein